MFILAYLIHLYVSPFSFEARNQRLLERMKMWKGRYEVDLPGCRIPYVDPFDPVIMEDWFGDDTTTCSPQPRYIFSTELRGNQTCLVVHNSVLLLDYGLLPDRLNCVYRIIGPRFNQEPWMNLYSYSESKKLEFHQCFDDPYIWIDCDVKQELRYKQTLFIAKDVPPRTKYISVDTRLPPILNRKLIPEKKLNVLVLGVDAVSRVMFHRLMQPTFRKLQRMYGQNMFELTAFNKVGANSAPNQIPMLTGKRFRHEEHLNNGEYFDDFGSFIWDNFSAAGYTTFFAEEQMRYGLFNYPSRNGFRDIPTDYWPRPLTIPRDQWRRKLRDYSGCMGDEHVSTTLLRYWIEVAKVSTSPTFSYIWLSEATHDSRTGAKTADLIVSQFLTDFERAGLHENTIVFLLADHGYRIGWFRETALGALEDLLPFAFVLLPRSYRKTNPTDVKLLEENRNRLTSPYDIHATLLDLAARHRGRLLEGTAKGESLLSARISPQRTCEAAGVEPQFCACYTQETVDPSSTSLRVIEMAEEAVDAVNQILRDNDDEELCHIFRRPEVLRIEGLGPPTDDSDFKFYKLTVGVHIDEVKFEAAFEIVDGFPKLIGVPERLDRYYLHSLCLTETFYEKFCYCK